MVHQFLRRSRGHFLQLCLLIRKAFITVVNFGRAYKLYREQRIYLRLLIIKAENIISEYRMQFTMYLISCLAGSRVQEEFNNRRYLCSLDEADREKLCEIARDYINYTVQFPITTSEANFLEFDLGNGVKKKHWVIACSLEGDHFMYFANQAGEAGHTISVLLKSKLMEQCIDTEIVAP